MSTSARVFVARMFFAAALTAGASKAVAAEPKKVAVQEFAARGVDPMVAANVAQVAATTLAQIGEYSVISNDDIKAMLGFEAKKLMLGCDDAECMSELGNSLGVDFILTGGVGVLGDTLSLTVSLIDIKKGTSALKGEAQVGDLAELPSATRQAIANMLGRTAPTRSIRGVGGLFVASTPEGARVFVDGVEMEGQTPLSVDSIKAGDHMVKVVKDDMTRRVPVFVEPDKIAKVNLYLSVIRAKFLSVPFDARVFIDEVERGTTPLLIVDLPAERHRVEFRKKGYKPHIEEVIFELTRFRQAGGEAFEVKADLEPLPVQVFVKSDPPGATVLLDGDEEGTTPTTVQGVLPGEYNLAVRYKGHRPYHRTVRIQAGKDYQTTIELPELLEHAEYAQNTAFRQDLRWYTLYGGSGAVVVGTALSILGWVTQGRADDKFTAYQSEIDPGRLATLRKDGDSLNSTARLEMGVGYTFLSLGIAALAASLVNELLMPPEPEYDETGPVVSPHGAAPAAPEPTPPEAAPATVTDTEASLSTGGLR